jgi:L-ornithine N5-monooxygenase
MASVTEQSTRDVNTRPTTPTNHASTTYDLIIIGFGPAQIATAIANKESRTPCKALFLERKPSFSWQTSPNLPRTRMNNPFVYDLATPRNPRSAFSYVNYLLAKDRLVEFANSDRLNPLREEFEDYLHWCAVQLKDQVRYGSEVIAIVPEKSEDVVRWWNVGVTDAIGGNYVVRAKSIVTPTLSPKEIPTPKPLLNTNFEAGQRIISINDYPSRRNELRVPREPRLDVTIIGSGMQTVEILEDLLTDNHLGNVTIVTENESLAPLKILEEKPSVPPPPPRLCSLWAKPSHTMKPSIGASSELIQKIYTRAYEKQLSSKGKYALRVVRTKDCASAIANSGIIISENPIRKLSSSSLFQGLDSIVLGSRSKGESLEEVQFKRGTVAEGCRIWMLSAHSEGGRSLAKDVAVRAGEMVKAVSDAASGKDAVVINARM